MVGAVAVQDAARVDRDEAAFVDADRARGREQLEVAAVLTAAALVDDDDAASVMRVPPRRLDAGAAAADDEDFGAAVLDVESPLPLRVREEDKLSE